MADVWDDPEPPITDPCTRRCGISSQLGYCRGCFRSLDEVARWERMTEWEQRQVVEKMKQREKSYNEMHIGK